MSGELRIRAEMKIRDGQLDAFRAATAKLGEVVAEKDTKTLDYIAFLDESKSLGIVFERYESSEGILEHMEHLTPHFSLILDASDVQRLEVYGEPSAEVMEKLSGFGQPICYSAVSPVAA